MSKKENIDVEQARQQTELFAALTKVGESADGSVLVTALRRQISSDIDSILANYKTASDIEIRANLSKVDSNLTILKALGRARENFNASDEYLKELMGIVE